MKKPWVVSEMDFLSSVYCIEKTLSLQSKIFPSCADSILMRQLDEPGMIFGMVQRYLFEPAVFGAASMNVVVFPPSVER